MFNNWFGKVCWNREADTDPKTEDDNVKTNEVELEDIGLRFVGLTKDTRSQYNLPKNLKGVVITAVKRDSFASRAGLTVGSVISQISQVNVKSADDAKKIFDDAVKKGTESVLLQVFQNDFSRFLILKIK